VGILAYGAGIFTYIIDYENTVMRQLLILEKPIFILMFLFTFIEIILALQTQTLTGDRARYNSKEFSLLQK